MDGRVGLELDGGLDGAAGLGDRWQPEDALGVEAVPAPVIEGESAVGDAAKRHGRRGGRIRQRRQVGQRRLQRGEQVQLVGRLVGRLLCGLGHADHAHVDPRAPDLDQAVAVQPDLEHAAEGGDRRVVVGLVEAAADDQMLLGTGHRHVLAAAALLTLRPLVGVGQLLQAQRGPRDARVGARPQGDPPVGVHDREAVRRGAPRAEAGQRGRGGRAGAARPPSCGRPPGWRPPPPSSTGTSPTAPMVPSVPFVKPSLRVLRRLALPVHLIGSLGAKTCWPAAFETAATPPAGAGVAGEAPAPLTADELDAAPPDLAVATIIAAANGQNAGSLLGEARRSSGNRVDYARERGIAGAEPAG